MMPRESRLKNKHFVENRQFRYFSLVHKNENGHYFCADIKVRLVRSDQLNA